MIKVLKQNKKDTDKKTNIKPKNNEVSFGEALKNKSEPVKAKPKTATKVAPKVTTKATPKAAAKSKPVAPKAKKVAEKPVKVPKTQTGMTKDVMVEFNVKTLKWTIRTSGSAKALKSFATQQEATAYGRLIAKNNMSELRVKGKDGKVRESSSHRK